MRMGASGSSDLQCRSTVDCVRSQNSVEFQMREMAHHDARKPRCEVRQWADVISKFSL